MKVTSMSYKIASWALVLGGVLHSLSDLLSPDTPERNEIMLQMKEITSQIFGTEFNMLSFFQGFSLMMGLLLFGYGALNLLILKNNQQADIPSNILILNIIVTLVTVMLSVKYFFIVPIVLTSIAFVGFSISFIAKINPFERR